MYCTQCTVYFVLQCSCKTVDFGTVASQNRCKTQQMCNIMILLNTYAMITDESKKANIMFLVIF
jgi:hypothetical protein